MKNLGSRYLYISIAVTMWGFSFLWTNQLIELGIPVTTFLFFRMLIAATILLIVTNVTKKLQRIEFKDFKYLVPLLICDPFLYFLGETYGLEVTQSPILTAVVIATIPAFVMLSEMIFFKNRLNIWNKLGVILSIIGIINFVLIKGSFSVEYWWGIGLLFMAVISAVVYSSMAKQLTRKYNTQTVNTYQFVSATIFFFPIFLIKDAKTFSFESILQFDVLYPLISLAVLCSALAFFLYVESIKALGMTRACIFTSLTPIISSGAAMLMGVEQISLIQFVSILLVVAGVIITQRKVNKKTNSI